MRRRIDLWCDNYHQNLARVLVGSTHTHSVRELIPLAHTIPDKYGFTLMNQSNLVRQQAAGATHRNTNKMTLTHACMQEDAHKSNQTEAYARARRGKLT